MSLLLLEFTRTYTNEIIDASCFVEAYIQLWKIENKLGISVKDEEQLNLFLASIFYIADLYNPDSDKLDYEFNDEQLFEKVTSELLSYDKKSIKA
ncbi:colicin immunity domain-containing protein [Moraxella atlantae]|uniref:Bacterial self-protective colicin-like immunity n=1 Tax=Faucicola atlantae TaxID=34059 RepID=A0A1B8QBN1_9GAMM|nr:colicin immunity domain-containing protein [Moraxella atlantae]OBX77154.1 colicin immunity protein [Moraxella atlantae]OPH35987.1 colicin immunity protein [Moraxella atlantae]STZ01731.1 Bacterial self-protective colicin-like immunity [Moraxella atlantae]